MLFDADRRGGQVVNLRARLGTGERIVAAEQGGERDGRDAGALGRERNRGDVGLYLIGIEHPSVFRRQRVLAHRTGRGIFERKQQTLARVAVVAEQIVMRSYQVNERSAGERRAGHGDEKCGADLHDAAARMNRRCRRRCAGCRRARVPVVVGARGGRCEAARIDASATAAAAIESVAFLIRSDFIRSFAEGFGAGSVSAHNDSRRAQRVGEAARKLG